ncbi:hypothetical protein [Bradyrhizobium sp. sBnM-33]|uniref:hypothetical protein n=1 Tax=Bradyrhizobium sp. sBnM-33 TaxID=2831780 RepID=UPI001BD1AEF1|nr:hypothetical protein [Bradyrhizobium sp. sBnM-33]WOH49385.1 hypothetical protein RX328_35805 [Bradyrhizobium sp. sBnM-33]
MADPFDIGDLSREIAAYVPIALVKQFRTQNLQCAACSHAGISAATAAKGLPVLDAAVLRFYRASLLT